MDSLPDFHLGLIIDILINSNGGLRDLCNFLIAYRRAWFLEKGHVFKKLFFQTGDAPVQWLTIHRKRIELVVFATQCRNKETPITWRTAYQRIKKSCARPLSQNALDAAEIRVQHLLVELVALNEQIETVSMAAIAISSNPVSQLEHANLDTLKEMKLETEVKIFVYKNLVKECDDLDREEQKIDNEMVAFLLCGARVFLLAQRSFPHNNIVGSIMECRAGFAWEPTKCNPNTSDTDELAVMLMNNPECYVKLINKVFAPHSMQRFDVLLQEGNCAVLVPFASRIDMSEFTIFCRNDRICYWTRGRFPTAQVKLAEPSSLMYGGEDNDSIDSEDTVHSDLDSDDTEDEE